MTERMNSLFVIKWASERRGDRVSDTVGEKSNNVVDE